MDPKKVNQLRKIASLSLLVSAAWKSRDKATLVRSMDALQSFLEYRVDMPHGLTYDDIADFDLQNMSISKNGDALFTINDKEYEVAFYYEAPHEDEAFAYITGVYEKGQTEPIHDELLIEFIQDKLDEEAMEQAYDLWHEAQIAKAEAWADGMEDR